MFISKITIKNQYFVPITPKTDAFFDFSILFPNLNVQNNRTIRIDMRMADAAGISKTSLDHCILSTTISPVAPPTGKTDGNVLGMCM